VGRCSILIPPHAAEVQKKPAMTASYITFLLPLHGVLTEHPSTTIYSWASLGEMLSLFTAAGVSLFERPQLDLSVAVPLADAFAERKRCAECVKQHFPGAADLLFLRRHKFFAAAILLRHFIDDFPPFVEREENVKSACSFNSPCIPFPELFLQQVVQRIEIESFNCSHGVRLVINIKKGFLM
jgi:hypothetical protein